MEDEEKIDKSLYIYAIIAIMITALLFALMMRFAEQGNAFMVILIAVLIGVVAFGIARMLKHFYLKQL
ncbi:hypothetical protein Mzhil_0788 [Methanosalsum zhilinae DSM 4017]|uniref:Uncharacterized protein n=1 Tax=Methanosalsum zhilinae (strain DSM 4017 / NBRC 107636 / OCM 62 / WeN5) TaxID=679901 RepID=F7XKP2_METZD|nr:hypothetical protein [Methanosalsum zhilinae]AEH60652.1 hypothetical protein Mzhil_0788 [Methanosalsum zhilinae DSM 4017]